MSAENAMRIGESWKTMRKYPTDILLWVGYNVVLGTAPIWLIFLIHAMTSQQRSWLTPLYEGDLIIFVTTLCASSVGVYGEITGEHFWNSKRMSLFILLTIVVVSAFVGAVISFPDAKQALRFSDVAVKNFSLLMFVVGLLTSVHLYAMRLSVEKIDDFRKEQKQQVQELTREAKTRSQTEDGTEL